MAIGIIFIISILFSIVQLMFLNKINLLVVLRIFLIVNFIVALWHIYWMIIFTRGNYSVDNSFAIIIYIPLLLNFTAYLVKLRIERKREKNYKGIEIP